MDPVLGLSRRQAMALALLVPLGIVVSTVATALSERSDSDCPDERYGCVALEPGEPVILGLLAASVDSMQWPLRDAVEEGIGRTLMEGHPVLVDVRLPGCSPEAAAEDVRELVSDPPDEPPAAVVVGAPCERAAAPVSQILSDTGTTLVALNEVGPVPTDPPYHLVGPQLDVGGQAGVQGIGVASHLRDLIAVHLATVLGDVVEAIDRVAIRDRDRLLIPRTPLRDALVEQGFARA